MQISLAVNGTTVICLMLILSFNSAIYYYSKMHKFFLRHNLQIFSPLLFADDFFFFFYLMIGKFALSTLIFLISLVNIVLLL